MSESKLSQTVWSCYANFNHNPIEPNLILRLFKSSQPILKNAEIKQDLGGRKRTQIELEVNS